MADERTDGAPAGGTGSSGGSNRNRNRNRSRNRNRGAGGQPAGSGGQPRSGERPRSNGQSRSGGGSRPGGQSNRNRGGSRDVAAAPVALAPRVIEPGLGASEILPGEVAANRRHAVWLCALAAVLPALVVGVVVALVASLVLGVVALVVAEVVIGYGLWRAAPGVALRHVGAVQVHEHDYPLVFNLTEGLCATFGLRMPCIYVVYDAVPNACALGRNAASAVLVVTSGLLETMSPIELEGVIAHELAHVKRDDNGVSVIALMLARYAGAGLLRRCVGEAREYRADVVGASALRYPRGLLDALRLMEKAPAPSGNSVFGPARFAATRYVWIDPSVGHHDEPMPVGDLDATSVRAAALCEW